MSEPQFHQSGYGRRFFESQLPYLIESINRLAKAVEESNRIGQSKPSRKSKPSVKDLTSEFTSDKEIRGVACDD